MQSTDNPVNLSVMLISIKRNVISYFTLLLFDFVYYSFIFLTEMYIDLYIY